MRISDWSSDVCSSDLVVVEHRVPDAFGGSFAALPACGFKQLPRGPGVGVDAGLLEGCIVRGLDVLDRQVECKIRSMLLHPVLALLKIAGNQVLAELLPFGLGEHAIVVAAGVVLGERSAEHTSELQSLMRI